MPTSNVTRSRTATRLNWRCDTCSATGHSDTAMYAHSSAKGHRTFTLVQGDAK